MSSPPSPIGNLWSIFSDIQIGLPPVATILCGLSAIWTLKFAYQLFFSPLRSIPGPWYAGGSGLWNSTQVLLLRRCHALHNLMKEYGPIVRVAPNIVVFTDLTAMRTVYGVNAKLNKTPMYEGFRM